MNEVGLGTDLQQIDLDSAVIAVVLRSGLVDRPLVGAIKSDVMGSYASLLIRVPAAKHGVWRWSRPCSLVDRAAENSSMFQI